jgi:hypothetical protein
MAMHWIDRTPERPDRYLDWDLVNRTARGMVSDGWCSVIVQLEVAPGQNPALHLEQLQAEMPNLLSVAQPTINATDEERSLLSQRIAELKSGAPQTLAPDDPYLTFFVYMQESRAYTAGAYTQSPNRKIRYVGPPIPGLRFAQQPAMKIRADIRRRQQAGSNKVAVGIIDHAIAFAQERFRTRRDCGPGDIDRSRVHRLWLQHVERSGTGPGFEVLFGRKLEKQGIEQALIDSAKGTGVINEDAIYCATGAVDFQVGLRQATAHRVGHGTHVMDLACGFHVNDPDGDDRPILAVQLPEAATLDTSGITMTSYVLQGLRQIILWADALEPDLPLVVNFSYGMYAGPKDGAHLLEREMRRLIEFRNRNPKTPTAIVLPAANTYLARVTATMSLAPGAHEAIDWVVLPDCGRPSFLEIWVDGTSGMPLDIQITPPGGAAGPVGMPNVGSAKVLREGTRAIGAMYVDTVDLGVAAGTSRCRITIAINPTKSYDPGQPVAPSGSWKVVATHSGSSAANVHLYIQREDTPASDQPPGRQSFFDHPNAYAWDKTTANYEALGSPGSSCPITYRETLSAIATDKNSIVVGSAFAPRPNQPSEPSLYTASGPTYGRPGPDFAAIADEDRAYPGVMAAGTRSGSVVVLNGTSVAAPQIARRLADAGLDISKLKSSLQASNAVQDARLGWGVIPAPHRPDIPSRRRP